MSLWYSSIPYGWCCCFPYGWCYCIPYGRWTVVNKHS
ncbi:uncharacterized protein CTRU02_215625 [Colletotrichum truncatum]|uniref:Uncharacterized protein n=1 Tax=Colletotrichum truncatum TaxID=5467 RepID=A0ACC3YC89_COLTU